MTDNSKRLPYNTFTIDCCRCSAPNTVTTKDFDENKSYCRNCGINLSSGCNV